MPKASIPSRRQKGVFIFQKSKNKEKFLEIASNKTVLSAIILLSKVDYFYSICNMHTVSNRNVSIVLVFVFYSVLNLEPISCIALYISNIRKNMSG